MNALPNIASPFFSLSEKAVRDGTEASRSSPRKRIILPIHRQQEAAVQRMLNFLQPGTYVQPHVHPMEHASETMLVLQGVLGFVIFSEEGEVEHCERLEQGGLVDIEPNIWHGLVALEADTVVLEIKRGPYDPETDKTFALWAPAEGDENAEAYLSKLVGLFS